MFVIRAVLLVRDNIFLPAVLPTINIGVQHQIQTVRHWAIPKAQVVAAVVTMSVVRMTLIKFIVCLKALKRGEKR